MWEITTGEVPFSQCLTNKEIREAVLSGQRPSIKPGSYNIKWAELMTRCWSHSASRRPTAAEIVSILEEISRIDTMSRSTKKTLKKPSSKKPRTSQRNDIIAALPEPKFHHLETLDEELSTPAGAYSNKSLATPKREV